MTERIKNKGSDATILTADSLIPPVNCVQRSSFVKTGPGHGDSEVVVMEVTEVMEVEGLWVHNTVLPHPPGCPPSVRTAG